MSSQGFSFPPPPPPPPQRQPQQQQHNPTYPSTVQYGQGHHNGQRGGRGGGGHHRGRGRGFGNRGAGRGGHFASSDVSHHSAYSPPVGYPPVNYSGYTAQSLPTHTPNIPPSQYTSSQSPGFQHQTPAAYASPQPFAQHAAAPYQRQPSYDAAYNPPTAQSTPSYPSVMAAHQRVPQPGQPPMMGPPMHWGFEQSGFTGSLAGGQHGHARGPRPFNSHGHQASTPDKPMKQYPNKRDHTSAFGKPQSVGPRTPAPPPVPSFGNPLPSKPPPPADASRKPKKKKRRHNQLGLTPKTEDHESSEEEDDVDEESRLAPEGGVPAAPLQFSYKGRTSKLQTASEIAAWIEERKKRFPTQARVDEKKKAIEEAKKARDAALKEKDARKQELRRPQKEARAPKDQQEKPIDAAGVAEKAKQKADKLRRKLAREEKRVAKAEADAEQARLQVEALQKKSMDNGSEAIPSQTAPNTDEAQPDQIVNGTSEQEPQTLGETEVTKSATTPIVSEDPIAQDTSSALIDDAVDISSSDSEASDWTSSSGSDVSSDSDESDDESAPEEVSSRREGPERVPPPPREEKKRVCRHFARSGRCLRGDKCKFSHELPERGSKAKPPPEKKGRKGLLQSLLERDKEDETRRVMEAITWLGENGMLEEPAEEVKEANEANESNESELPVVQDSTNNSGGEEGFYCYHPGI